MRALQKRDKIIGADIHFFRERKTTSLNYEGPKDLQYDRDRKINEVIDDKPLTENWVSADSWSKNGPIWQNHEVFYSRNYYLFSILADVRNSGNVQPICDPRGIPDDASSGYMYAVDRWEGDAHSHSYFTLEELLLVDWDQYDTENLQEFLNVVQDLKKIDTPDKVRICFFFDN
jgi:hypothetical protein